MDNMLERFEEIIEEELHAYEDLGELYQIKQSILVQRNSDALWEIDAKILSKAENIKKLNMQRKATAGYLGDESMTLSQIIEKAKEQDEQIAKRLSEKQEKMKLLAQSLTLQEETNLTLIKHGLIMVSKTIDIIAGVVSPQSKQYNKLGKNIEQDKSSISSIIEEV